uniref:ditrans,polycis-polyprenyl diphosphate synthase [(2E,6E)-farnesyldiphosphate specific] n=1 Tax=Compsopogon caeruleus TaxID=31354 RepID=A0A7S1XC82_9RHOD
MGIAWYGIWRRLWEGLSGAVRIGGKLGPIRGLSSLGGLCLAVCVDPQHARTHEGRDHLVRLIEWSVELGIGTVQLFDGCGSLAAASEELVEAIKTHRQRHRRWNPLSPAASSWASPRADGAGRRVQVRISGHSGQGYHTIASQRAGEENWENLAEKEEPLVTSSDVTVVRLLTPRNGRKAIAEYGSWLANLDSFTRQSEDDRKAKIEEVLREDPLSIMAGGEPNLLIAFGSLPSVMGFPCWELRLTQLYLQRDLRTFSRSDFEEILLDHVSTPIRFGR